MTSLLWENKVLVCDICKKNEMKKTIRIKGEWLGICENCEPKEVKKNEKP